MSKKHFFKIHHTILFAELVNLKPYPTINIRNPTVSSLEYSIFHKLNHTGHFFKKSALLGLAIALIGQGSDRVPTLRSILLTLWNSIAAYNFIF